MVNYLIVNAPRGHLEHVALRFAGGLAKDAALTPRPMSQRKGLRSHETCSLRAEGLAVENTQRARTSLAQVSSQVSAR